MIIHKRNDKWKKNIKNGLIRKIKKAMFVVIKEDISDPFQLKFERVFTNKEKMWISIFLIIPMKSKLCC